MIGLWSEQASGFLVAVSLFAILIGGFALMVAVHVWSAVRNIQPLSETLETFLGRLVGAGAAVLPQRRHPLIALAAPSSMSQSVS